jgi:hypothetical protein
VVVLERRPSVAVPPVGCDVESVPRTWRSCVSRQRGQPRGNWATPAQRDNPISDIAD